MTEVSPLGTIAPRSGAPADTHSRGRPPMGLDLKLTDADGATLPQQRGVVGHLRVKGPAWSIATSRPTSDALDEEGYFDTGDLAMIDEAGNLTICGRSKDLIKSGGEWINPAEIEAIVGRASRLSVPVAVIGRADAKWGERPVLIVEPRQGQTIDAQAPARIAARQDRRLVAPRRDRAGRSRCRSPRRARSTSTSCAPTTPRDGSQAERRASIASSWPQAAVGGFGAQRPTFQPHARACPLARRRHITVLVELVHPGHQIRAPGVGVAAKCM